MKMAATVAARMKRKRRIRKRIFGTDARPRMSVYKSNKHIYVQVIDDTRGATLATASSLAPGLRGQLGGLRKLDVAKRVGELVAKTCIEAQISKVVFDRNGYIYSGRVAAVAEAARAGGLEF